MLARWFQAAVPVGMTRRSHGKRGRHALAAGAPRVLPLHKGPLARAYRLAFLALVERYGKPAHRGELETAMSRAAIARARLVLATEAWGALASRRRHTDDSRAELRAAEKAMNRADEAVSRALGDLRSTIPPEPALSAKERERLDRQAEAARASAEIRARAAARDAAGKPEAENVGAGTEDQQRTV